MKSYPDLPTLDLFTCIVSCDVHTNTSYGPKHDCASKKPQNYTKSSPTRTLSCMNASHF